MDGNVMLSTELDTRPVTQSLSNLKRKIVEVFKGADIKSLQLGLKEVTTEIKATEAQARKAQTALDALMSGEKTPQSIKNLERDLKLAQKESDTLDAKWRKLKATSAELQASINAGTLTPAKERAAVDKLASVREELRAVQQAANEADAKVVLLQKSIRFLKQNPELTPEAQRYLQVLDETSRKLPELQARYEQLGNEAQRVGLATRLQQNSIVNGFQHIERRIMGLVKRVFFFTLITKALRAVRSQISALITGDSQLSASLAQVKANLAASFGMIWSAVVPAIRTMVNWLAKATAYIAAFISWLTGKSFKQGQEVFQSANDASAGIASNTGKIGKAAKKAAKEAQRMLLPFDQMNVLSKDSAGGGDDGAGGGGAGGGAGGLGGLDAESIDKLAAKFEKFKDLILLIGAAFAAWKLSKILSTLLGISRIKAFVGLTALIMGISLLVRGIRNLIKNGPNVENVCDIIAGALLTVGGAILLFTGATGLGLIVIAIGAVVLAFKNLYKNSKSFRDLINKMGRGIKKFFGGLWKQLKDSAKELKKAFSGSGVFFKVLKTARKEAFKIGKYIILGLLKGILWVIKKLGSWVKKNIVKPFIKWVKKRFGIASPAKEMLDIGENIALGILEGILKPFKDIGAWIKEHVLDPIKNAFISDDGENAFSISTKFVDTKETLANKWEEITSGIKEKVATIWSEVKEKVNGAIETLKEHWTTIKDKTATLTNAIKEKVKGALEKLKNSWNAIKNKTASLTSKLKGVSQSKLNKFKNAWNAIKSKSATLSMNLKAALGGAYNAAARKINGLINKLPAVVRPSWRLPYLAQGAVIPPNKEFLAMLGDQKHGTNIETPLQTMIDAFNTALKQNGYGGGGQVNVYLQGDAKQLFKVVRIEANNYTQATGKAAFNL